MNKNKTVGLTKRKIGTSDVRRPLWDLGKLMKYLTRNVRDFLENCYTNSNKEGRKNP